MKFSLRRIALIARNPRLMLAGHHLAESPLNDLRVSDRELVRESPIWVSLPVFVGGFVVVSCLIVLALRPVVRRIVDDVEQWDRVLGHVIGTFGVFFGILLALVAVSVYENYADTREAALHEAGQITALYRGTTGLPEEVAEPIEATIKEYLQAVIEEDWPDQRRGELPDGRLRLVNQIEEEIHEYSRRVCSSSLSSNSSWRHSTTSSRRGGSVSTRPPSSFPSCSGSPSGWVRR